jgi:hypothetical protein
MSIERVFREQQKTNKNRNLDLSTFGDKKKCSERRGDGGAGSTGVVRAR